MKFTSSYKFNHPNFILLTPLRYILPNFSFLRSVNSVNDYLTRNPQITIWSTDPCYKEFRLFQQLTLASRAPETDPPALNTPATLPRLKKILKVNYETCFRDKHLLISQLLINLVKSIIAEKNRFIIFTRSDNKFPRMNPYKFYLPTHLQIVNFNLRWWLVL